MDRRKQKTRDAIRTAYFQLLQQKKDNRISIAELTRLANIDRKTFYLHYNCIEDIVDDFCNEKVQDLLDRLRQVGFVENPLHIKEMFRTLNDVLEENREYFRLLSYSNDHPFWERTHNIMVQSLLASYAGRVKVSRDEMKIYCDFFVAGLIRLYRDYPSMPAGLTPELIEAVILDIALNGVTNLLKDVN